MKKLVIKMYKPKDVISGNIVRINDEAVQKIQQMQRLYGISARELISRIIVHYADDVEFDYIKE